MLSKLLASATKMLGVRGDEFLRVSHLVLFWFLYYYIPCLGIHLLHYNHSHFSLCYRLSAAGGQGLCLVPKPLLSARVCTGLHRLSNSLCNVCISELKFASQVGQKSSIL